MNPAIIIFAATIIAYETSMAVILGGIATLIYCGVTGNW